VLETSSTHINDLVESARELRSYADPETSNKQLLERTVSNKIGIASESFIKAYIVT
jgi:hypothetical protein